MVPIQINYLIHIMFNHLQSNNLQIKINFHFWEMKVFRLILPYILDAKKRLTIAELSKES